MQSKIYSSSVFSKKFLLALAVLIFLFVVQTQAQLHPNFAAKLSGAKTPANISLFVKGDVEKTKSVVAQLGGYFKYAAGDISSVVIPANQYDNFMKSDFYEQVQRPYYKGRTMGDQSRINNNVVPVQAGTAPLTQAYDGTGVVVGVLDSGIDINHGDFKLPNGHTRIKYLWDQTMTTGGTTPAPYGYGQNWDSTSINNHTCTHTPDLSFYGHGTLTTGVACGNSQTHSAYRAMAPNADIIFVAIDFSSPNFETLVADGAAYCFAKAALMGKPCVINASLGNYAGSHDGTDLATQTIENLLTAQNGRAFVSAAGNGGGAKMHLGYTIPTNDSAYTFFNEIPGYGVMYFELFSDYADFNNVQFAIGADKTSPVYVHRNRTKMLNVLTDYNMGSLTSYTRYDTIRNNSNQQLGILESYCEKQNGHYFMYFGVYIDSSTNYTWRFVTKGSGKFDVWSHPNFTGTSLMRATGLPTVGQLPDIIKYAMPDTEKTIVSGWNCSAKCISVANYLNRGSFPNWQGGTTICDSHPVGSRYPTSSKGPTRTGAQKPDIAASGEWTMAANDLYWLNWAKTNNPSSILADTMHGPHKGTSAAAPAVAGIVALYLQKYPTASWSDIKTSLTTCVKTDSYTGNSLPNVNWGYGKIDAFKMLNCKGCTSPSSSNYNSYSQINDGSCLPPAPAPANDVVCNAVSFPSAFNQNLIYQATANNALATVSASDPTPSCATISPAKTVWYKFIAPTCGSPITIEISTDNATTNFNTVLSVYSMSGTCASPTYAEIGCNDDNTGSAVGASKILLTSSQYVAGQTYYVMVAGKAGAVGTYKLTLKLIMPTISVIGGATNSGSITISIPSTSNFSSERVLWRKTGTTGYSYTNVTANSTSSYPVSNLLSSQQYDIWVGWVCAGGYTYYSDIVQANTTAGCGGTLPAPTITNYNSLHCAQVNVSWAAVPGATSYRVYLNVQGSNGFNYYYAATNSLNATFATSNSNINGWYLAVCNGGAQATSAITAHTNCGGTPRTSNPNTNQTLEHNGIYYVDVPMNEILVDPTVDGSVSGEINFNQIENSTNNIIPIANEMTIEPNPASDFVKIILPLNENETAQQLLIYDMKGVLMKKIINRTDASKNNWDINVSHYSSGMYTVMIKTNQTQTVKKFVKL